MPGRNAATPHEGREPIARTVRSLPAAPSLEYERKEAKALLKSIRAGDAETIRRVRDARPAALRERPHDELQLADAQHVIAREYGFTSWPRLVEYFEEMERHRIGPRHNSNDDGLERFEEFAQSVMRRHKRGDPIVARELAHFVPRFFARSIDEILATPITEEDARLVVARERRRVSWDELHTRARESRAKRDRFSAWTRDESPIGRARIAIRDSDLDALIAVLDDHPEAMSETVIDREWRDTLVSIALSFERDKNTPEARRITDYLASRGVDIQHELDQRLLGWMHDRGNPDAVRWYLERGANPNWMPPSGFSVLEHALVRFKNPECVDLIAARVTPPRALWIAAGLGDVDGVRSFIAGKGKLTAEGRKHRPDTMAMGWFVGLPPHRDADDLEIMYEAFQIAGWNQRWATMDVLLDAGLPIDLKPLGMTLLQEAAGNMMVSLAEYLVKRGADVDLDSTPPNGTPREFARMHFTNNPNDPETRRLLAACKAGDPDGVLAEVDAKRPSPPPPDPRTLRVMQLAADDAARVGQPAVTTENILVGILRAHEGLFASLIRSMGTDMAKLRDKLGDRLVPDADPLLGQELPGDAEAQAAVRAAAAEADRRRRESVHVMHLFKAIAETGAAARLLTDAGMKPDLLTDRLKGAL